MQPVPGFPAKIHLIWMKEWEWISHHSLWVSLLRFCFLLLVNVSWNRFNSEEEEESKCSNPSEREIFINMCAANTKTLFVKHFTRSLLAVTTDVTDHSPAAVKEWRQCLLRECDPNEFILLRTWTGKFAICICCLTLSYSEHISSMPAIDIQY